jgi:hypothetical protein
VRFARHSKYRTKIIWSPKTHYFCLAIGTGLWAIKPLNTCQTLHRTISIPKYEIEIVIWNPKTHDFCMTIGTGLWAIKPLNTCQDYSSTQ